MPPRRAEPFIREVRLSPDEHGDSRFDPDGAFPWTTEAVQALAARPLALHPRCTFLVGANGSGKSTLVEGIAVAAGLGVDGGGRGFGGRTPRPDELALGDALTLVRGSRRPRTEFFLRAESMLGFATRLDQFVAEAQAEGRDGREWLAPYGGVSLNEQSHGESFLTVLTERFGPNGLYLLDEPESALSPQSLLALLARIDELCHEGSQFVIATHSPILLALPNARIMEVAGGVLEEVDYDDVEAVQLTRLVLADPEGMMRRLLGD